MSYAQPDYGQLWDRFIAHQSKHYGFPVKNLIGGAGKYRQVFIEAQKAHDAVESHVDGALASERQQQAYDMARRLLWLAFVWNDHNFEHPMVVAQNEARKHGIQTWEQANAWLESFDAPAAELAAQSAPTQSGEPIELWNNPGFDLRQRLEIAAGAVVFWRKVAKHREKRVPLPVPQPALPPYVYGRETGANEKVFTEADVRAYGLACYEAGAGRAKGSEDGKPAAPAGHAAATTLVQEPSCDMIEVCMRAMYNASQGDFNPTVGEAREICRAVLARATVEAKPLDMVLHCPKCGRQHIDEPNEAAGWTNPEHKSHLCRKEDGGCGTVWRPADVATNGVASVTTRGKADTWPAASKEADHD